MKRLRLIPQGIQITKVQKGGRPPLFLYLANINCLCTQNEVTKISIIKILIYLDVLVHLYKCVYYVHINDDCYHLSAH